MTVARGRVAQRPAGALWRCVALSLAVVVGDLLRIRRRHVEQAMERAGVVAPARTARSMYRSLAEGLVELVRMAFVQRASPLPVAVPAEVVEALRADGRGAVIATAHTGNWDLAACAVASGAPLVVVTKRLRVAWLDRVWQGARRERGVELVEAGAASRAASRALAQGKLVAMLIDQAPERRRGATQLSFLGAPAWVDLAPALCAARARVPLVVAFPRRVGGGAHTIEVVATLEPPRRPSRRWVVDAMTTATRALEAFVARHPDQWLWMHRRWKDAPALPERAPRAPRLAGVSP